MMKGFGFQLIEWEEEGSGFGRLEKKLIDLLIKRFSVCEFCFKDMRFLCFFFGKGILVVEGLKTRKSLNEELA
jgi:hypothetical protein